MQSLGRYTKPVIWGTLLVLGCVSSFQAGKKKPKPQYKGQSVSYWLDHLHNHDFYQLPDFVNQEALNALQAMGSDAVPYLTSALKERTYRKRNVVAEFFRSTGQSKYLKPFRSLLPRNRKRPSGDYDLMLKVLGDMGPEAYGAIPFLIEEVEQPQHFHMGNRGEVAEALEKIIPGSGFENEAIDAIKESKKLPLFIGSIAMKLNQSLQTIENSLGKE